MKRIIIIAGILSLIFASCSVTKRDCQGRKHTKQPGGFYLFVKPVCPDCGETECIYEHINNHVEGEGTDIEIMDAINEVCKERGITDPKVIDLLKANYYL